MPSTLVGRVHLFRQSPLNLLGNSLLRDLWYGRTTSGVADARIPGCFRAGTGIVDGVWDLLFDGPGKLLLELLGYDAVAYGVRLVGSLRHLSRFLV